MSKPIRYLKLSYILMRKSLDEELSAYHLTTSQFEILGYLYGEDQLEQQQLQQYSGVTPATLTGILDKLEQRDLLRRSLSHDDGRAKMVGLTTAGQELVGQLINVFHSFEAKMLQGFSAAERALFTDWLQRVAANLGYHEPD
ncbi:MarR family winged helix-turn-helix transcriptional regulator [Herpetosiphon llansteffanensis]|uniref:MarR family winged helix-turn-helix transcriptional regulator n=1 Tax=Herpetosiphon llansteffanensis TaxID=2094568 RepID=UPI000D7C0902|nr:MarR family transcriptional regulator [Herpetosiphon llansteffanensis]